MLTLSEEETVRSVVVRKTNVVKTRTGATRAGGVEKLLRTGQPLNTKREKALTEQLLGDVVASEGVPALHKDPEQHDRIAHAAQMAVCGSEYVQKQTFFDRSKVAAELLEALGLDANSQKYAVRRKAMGVGDLSTTESEGRRVSGYYTT